MNDNPPPDIEVVEPEIINLPALCPLPPNPRLECLGRVNPALPSDDEKKSVVEVQLVTVKEAQRILSIGRSKAFELMARGLLERRRIDGCTRVTMKSILALVEGRS